MISRQYIEIARHDKAGRRILYSGSVEDDPEEFVRGQILNDDISLPADYRATLIGLSKGTYSGTINLKVEETIYTRDKKGVNVFFRDNKSRKARLVGGVVSTELLKTISSELEESLEQLHKVDGE